MEAKNMVWKKASEKVKREKITKKKVPVVCTVNGETKKFLFAPKKRVGDAVREVARQMDSEEREIDSLQAFEKIGRIGALKIIPKSQGA